MRKILAVVFAAALAAALAVPAAATPYREIVVGEGETVIEAVWFDIGIYHVVDFAGNRDMRPDSDVATYDYTINMDYGGGRETDTPSCIGWIQPDEWVQYTFEVAVAGTFHIAVWGAAGPGGDVRLVLNDDVEIGTVFVAGVGDWHYYSLYDIGTFHMGLGTNTIRTEFLDGGINVESYIITLVEADPLPEPEPEEAPAAVEAPAEAAPAAEAAEAAKPAPQTFDPVALVALGALVSAAGILAVRRRRR